MDTKKLVQPSVEWFADFDGLIIQRSWGSTSLMAVSMAPPKRMERWGDQPSAAGMSSVSLKGLQCAMKGRQQVQPIKESTLHVSTYTAVQFSSSSCLKQVTLLRRAPHGAPHAKAAQPMPPSTPLTAPPHISSVTARQSKRCATALLQMLMLA